MTNIDNEDSLGEPTQFTPGTWSEYAPPILSDDDNGEYKKYETEETYRYIVSGKGYYDAETGKGFALSGYISPADARLLAAAPELLRALQWMQLIIDTHGPQTSWGVAARQIAEIIAKVEGRDVAEPSGESEVA